MFEAEEIVFSWFVWQCHRFFCIPLKCELRKEWIGTFLWVLHAI